MFVRILIADSCGQGSQGAGCVAGESPEATGSALYDIRGNRETNLRSPVFQLPSSFFLLLNYFIFFAEL